MYWRPTTQQRVFDTNKTMLVLYYSIVFYYFTTCFDSSESSSGDSYIETCREIRKHDTAIKTSIVLLVSKTLCCVVGLQYITICLNTQQDAKY
jgi:hypothetical protein